MFGKLFLLLAAVFTLWVAARVQTQQAYILTDVAPAVSSYVNEKNLGINASGQVAGTTLDSSGAQRTYLWTPNPGDLTRGTLTLLPLPKGANMSNSAAVNASGQVAGTGFKVSNGGISSIYAQLWSTIGSVTSIKPESRGYGINASGQVTGNASFSSSGPTHAFLFTNGKIVDIGAQIGTGGSQGWDINKNGWIVGWFEPASGMQAFVWAPSQPNGTIGTASLLPFQTAYALNDQGQIVGIGNNGHAILYSAANGLIDLGVQSGFDGSSAQGINNTGQVVESQWNNTTNLSHAFLWDSINDLRDLNDPTQFTLYDPSGNPIIGWVLSSGNGINDNGQIVGFGYNPAGQKHVFLLTPR